MFRSVMERAAPAFSFAVAFGEVAIEAVINLQKAMVNSKSGGKIAGNAQC